MNDWKILALSLAFVAYMARLQKVNRRAMKFAGILVCALAGYSTVPLLTAGLAGPVQYSGVESLGPGPGPGGGGVLSIFRRGGGTTPAGVVGPPNTPSGASVTVVDTSTWWADFPTFVGSGSDTQDSIAVTVLRLAAADTLFHAKSGVQTRDTISDNTDLKSDTTYRVLFRQKGLAGGWSAAHTDTVVNSPIPIPSGTIRFDTRSGGAQDIQASANLAAALSATGFTEYDPGAGDIDFATDADGAGSNAFRFDWPGVAAATETDLMLYRGMTGVASGDTYIQFKIWQTRTASGGGIGTAGDWDCCSQGPGSGKRLVWFRGTGGNTGRITYAPGAGSGTGQFFVESTYNPSNASTAVDWDDYVSQWITLTIRVLPESSVSASDGVFQVWFNSTQTHNVTSADTYSTTFAGELQIGGPTWIGTPQDQTMYVKDIVVWQP